MKHWDLRRLVVEPHHPQILHSSRGEARSIVIDLPAGERLQEHQVHERAYVLVIEGEVGINGDGVTVRCESGFMAVFDPGERHELHATKDTRLLLLLVPWPGEGHPGARD